MVDLSIAKCERSPEGNDMEMTMEMTMEITLLFVVVENQFWDWCSMSCWIHVGVVMAMQRDP